MNHEELEQVIYERTRYFVDGRVMDCIFELIAEEREACAKVCDAKAERNFPWSSENADKYHAQADWANVCAEAIRARGEVPR